MIRGDQAVLTYLDNLPTSLSSSLESEIAAITKDLVAYIQQNKLSGQALNIQSGRLINSITDSIQTTKESILGTVSQGGMSDKNFPYGWFHENMLGNYKTNINHSFMMPSLMENKANIIERIRNTIGSVVNGK